MSQSVTKRVREIAAEQLGLSLEQVELSSRIVDDLFCDSLDGAELILQMEEEFDVDIAETFTPITVADVVNAVQEALTKRDKHNAS